MHEIVRVQHREAVAGAVGPVVGVGPAVVEDERVGHRRGPEDGVLVVARRGEGGVGARHRAGGAVGDEPVVVGRGGGEAAERRRDRERAVAEAGLLRRRRAAIRGARPVGEVIRRGLALGVHLPGQRRRRLSERARRSRADDRGPRRRPDAERREAELDPPAAPRDLPALAQGEAGARGRVLRADVPVREEAGGVTPLQRAKPSPEDEALVPDPGVGGVDAAADQLRDPVGGKAALRSHGHGCGVREEQRDHRAAADAPAGARQRAGDLRRTRRVEHQGLGDAHPEAQPVQAVVDGDHVARDARNRHAIGSPAGLGGAPAESQRQDPGDQPGLRQDGQSATGFAHATIDPQPDEPFGYSSRGPGRSPRARALA